MAWTDDGRTFQYLAETGGFHENSALSDDYVWEQVNDYHLIDHHSVAVEIAAVERYAPVQHRWIVKCLQSQPLEQRITLDALGVRAPVTAEHLERTEVQLRQIGAITLDNSSPVDAFSTYEEPSIPRNDLPCNANDQLPAPEWVRSLVPADLEMGPKGEVGNTVTRLILEAIRTEPEITRAVLASSTEAFHPMGLEQRLKAPASLTRKVSARVVARSVAAPDHSIRRIAAEIPDLVRFTLVTRNHDGLLGSAQRASDVLNRKGHTLVSAEHSYVAHNVYKGFKTIWASPLGQTYEVQFRSDLALELKNRAYPHYKLSRNLDAPIEARRKSFEVAAQMYAELPTPTGLEQDARIVDFVVVPRVFPSPFAIWDHQ